MNKAGKLSKSEWDAIRQHPAHGAELAADLLPWLGPWGLAIVEHHEHYDGSGYPAGLSGTHISLAGRIVAVADSFETMTAARPYKKARTRAAALEELVRFSNKQFDPDVVRALLAVSAPKLAWAMGPASWLTGLPFIGSAPSLTGAGIAAQAATGVAGVAAASVAGVAVAAVPANPVPTPQPTASAARTVVAVGSTSPTPHPAAHSVPERTDSGRVVRANPAIGPRGPALRYGDSNRDCDGQAPRRSGCQAAHARNPDEDGSGTAAENGGAPAVRQSTDTAHAPGTTQAGATQAGATQARRRPPRRRHLLPWFRPRRLRPAPCR